MNTSLFRFNLSAFAVIVVAIVMPPMAEASYPVEHWEAVSDNAVSLTGNVIFGPGQFVFGNGKSLKVDKPIALPNFVGDNEVVTATFYRVTTPTELTLLNAQHLCGTVRKSLPITFVIIWVPGNQPPSTGQRAMAVYSGTSLPKSDHDADSCGSFAYEVYVPK